jgi:hypothetical protein
MNILKTLSVGLVVLSVTVGCSKKRSEGAGDAVKALNAFAAISSGASLIQKRAQRLHSIEQRMNRGLQQSGFNPNSDEVCDSITPSATEAGCTVSSCSFNLSTGAFALAMSCTMEDESLTCGTDTFTFKNATASQDMNVVMNLTTGELTSGTLDLTMTGDLTSNNLNGALDCSVSMDFADSSNGEFDCDDSNFKCSIGGSAFTCADMKAAQATSTCQ